MVRVDIGRKFDDVCSKLLASLELPNKLLKDGGDHLRCQSGQQRGCWVLILIFPLGEK